ncbi:hypothetical protein, partial [Pseudomonas amygdali]|uniref:hypothetical protein n=1 Tax=Pseudomonas amygdali TaxID=47877 RepID=UPI003454E450
ELPGTGNKAGISAPVYDALAQDRPCNDSLYYLIMNIISKIGCGHGVCSARAVLSGKLAWIESADSLRP